MEKSNKTKNKKKKVLIILILLVVLAIIGCGIYYYYFKGSEDEVKVVKKIDNWGYGLNDNETQLYKDTFDELAKILNKDKVDYDAYAKTESKLFIIDFYTLTNKLSKNDIGGTDFIEDSMKDNFIEQVRSTFYKYLEVKSSDRKQDLPEVSKITDISVKNTTFTYSDKTVDEEAYKVTISWDFKEDLGYENEANMVLVKQDKKLYIVEMD